MSVKVYENGAWRDASFLKRFDGSSWTDCKFARKYENGQWVDVWSNYNYSWQGPYTDLPYYFIYGSAVFYHGEIHILGGTNDSTAHWAWDGSSWRRVSTLPYNFFDGAAVVFNDAIHIIGGGSSTFFEDSIYRFNGSSWDKVGEFPMNFQNGSAVVYNGEIHVLGSSNSTYYYEMHIKSSGGDLWNFTKVSTMPERYLMRCAVFKGEIHGFRDSQHYAWNGSSWRKIEQLNFSSFRTIVFNDELHVFTARDEHYIWNGSEWRRSNSDLPYSNYSAIVATNTAIHILGGSSTSTSSSGYAKQRAICVMV